MTFQSESMCVVSRNVSVYQPWIQKREIKSLFRGMCQSVNHGYRRERSRGCFKECVSLSTMHTEERDQELVSRNVSVCQPWIQKREIKSLFRGMCQSVNCGYRREQERVEQPYMSTSLPLPTHLDVTRTGTGRQ